MRSATSTLRLLPALAALALAGCGQSQSSIADDGETPEQSISDDGDASGQEGDPTIRKGGESWEEYEKRRDGYDGSRGTFKGRGCTVDCGGHDAGYAWAEEHDITDPEDCGGKSWSFEEGCRAWAEEQSGGDEGEDDE